MKSLRYLEDLRTIFSSYDDGLRTRYASQLSEIANNIKTESDQQVNAEYRVRWTRLHRMFQMMAWAIEGQP